MTIAARVVPCRAPGEPGHEPTWTSSAKSGVGTALDAGSHVWFTISHGIVDEVSIRAWTRPIRGTSACS